MSIFDDDEIVEALAGLDGWEHDGDAIAKTFEFESFGAAIDFMGQAAPAIDKLDHHPEWTNVYNKIDVRLSSHDVGGVTERDLKLAQLLDGLTVK